MAKPAVEEGEIPEPIPDITLKSSPSRPDSPPLPNADPYAAHNVANQPSSADLYPRASHRVKDPEPLQEKTANEWQDVMRKQQLQDVARRPRPPPPLAKPSRPLSSAQLHSFRGTAFGSEAAEGYRVQPDADAFVTEEAVNVHHDYVQHPPLPSLSYAHGDASAFQRRDQSYVHPRQVGFVHDHPPPFVGNEHRVYARHTPPPFSDSGMNFQQDESMPYTRNPYDAFNRTERALYWHDKQVQYHPAEDERMSRPVDNADPYVPQEYRRPTNEERAKFTDNESNRFRDDNHLSYNTSRNNTPAANDQARDKEFSYEGRDSPPVNDQLMHERDGQEGHSSVSPIPRDHSAYHLRNPLPPPSSQPASAGIPVQSHPASYSPTDPFYEPRRAYAGPSYPGDEYGYLQHDSTGKEVPNAANNNHTQSRSTPDDYTPEGFGNVTLNQNAPHVRSNLEGPPVFPPNPGQVPPTRTGPVFPFSTTMPAFTSGYSPSMVTAHPPVISNESLDVYGPRPMLVQEVEDEEAPAAGSAQQTMEKEKMPQRKKAAKPDLKALKAKALLSLKQKKRENKAKKQEDIITPISHLSVNEEQMQGAQVSNLDTHMSGRGGDVGMVFYPWTDSHAVNNINMAGRSGDFGISFFPGADGQSLSDEKLIIYLSDDEDDIESEEEDENGDSGTLEEHANVMTDPAQKRKLLRKQLIENMKIRSVQLGNCPTSLIGKSPKTQDTSNEKPTPVSPRVSPVLSSEEKINLTPVTPPCQNGEGLANDDESSKGAEGKEKDLPPTDVPVSSICRDEANPEKKDAACSQNASSDSDKKEGDVKEARDTVEGLSRSNSRHSNAPVSAPAPMLSKMKKKDDIETIRRRIAELERSKEVQRRNSNATNSNPEASDLVTGLNVSNSADPAFSNGMPSAENGSQKAIIKKRGRQKTGADPDLKLSASELKRYFSMETPRKEARSSSDRTDSQSPKPHEASPPEFTVNAQATSGEVDEVEEVQSAWNQRSNTKTVSRTVDVNANTGLVNDLKSELETSKRQLATVQDYSRLVMAADVSLAQASAKLHYKQNTVRGLEEELRKAQADLDEAENEFETMESAAKRLRASVEDLPFAESLFPPPDVSAGQTTSARGNRNGRVGTKQEEVPELVATANAESTDMDVTDVTGSCESDVVLQPSPYTPADGNMFSSCLSGLRAFVLRIPHHSQAVDRKSYSPLSLTWTHNLDPMKIICPRELKRRCPDKNCEFEHLRSVKSGVGRALDVVDQVQGFFDKTTVREAEKDIVRAKIDIYSGKNVDQAVSSLIQTLCPVPSKSPYSSRPSEQSARGQH